MMAPGVLGAAAGKEPSPVCEGPTSSHPVDQRRASLSEPAGSAQNPTSRVDASRRPRAASVIVRPSSSSAGAPSEILRARSEGPLRLLFPRGGGPAAWIITSSLGGGFVDGDHLALDVEVQAGAIALLSTQSSTKVYRGTSSQRTRVTVGADATALVVPDPVVPFRDASFSQRTDVELDPSASLVLIDVLTAGRVAFGERWDSTRIDSTLAVHLGDERRFYERLLLERQGRPLAERMGRYDVIGTALVFGPRFDEEAAELAAGIAAAPAPRDAKVIVSASAFSIHRTDHRLPNATSSPPLGVVVRVAAETTSLAQETIRKLVGPCCAKVGEDPWSRRW